jgi:hypothetical protein
MFVDRAEITVKAGNGGNGCCSFRREAFVPKGGPNGGDGGDGGDVIFVASTGELTLSDFVFNRHFSAENGGDGRSKDMHGRRGQNLVIKVPLGTIIRNKETGDVLAAAQRPTFNPNDRSTMTPESSANRLSELALEPGSIMKPFVVSYALDRGFVTPNSIVDCEQGVWKYAGRLLHDTHNVGKVPVTVTGFEIVKKSLAKRFIVEKASYSGDFLYQGASVEQCAIITAKERGVPIPKRIPLRVEWAKCGKNALGVAVVKFNETCPARK